MKIVENGDYKCAMYGCKNIAHHSQNTTMGTVLLCHDHLGKVWNMTDIGIKRLKGEIE